MVQEFAQQDEQDVLDHWEDTVDAEEETQTEEKAAKQHEQEDRTVTGKKTENAIQKGRTKSVYFAATKEQKLSLAQASKQPIRAQNIA
eukprot:4822254-Ditylum_brightwellii.AAC.1